MCRGVSLLVRICLLVLCVVFSGSCNAPDRCEPRTFQTRCTDRPGTYRACVWIDNGDYLIGVGQTHYSVETVTCPGFKPNCREMHGRASCRDK